MFRLQLKHIFVLFFISMILLAIRGHYSCNFVYIPEEEMDKHLVKRTNFATDSYIKSCKFDLLDNIKPHIQNSMNMNQPNIDSGEYIPKCKPTYSTAIIVPVRNRKAQLDVFIPYMHEFLMNQNIHYRIFVVEQMGDDPWNKGKLYNIGANIARNLNFPCLIFHDVDLLPETRGNLYACTTYPRHMSANIDKFRYNLPYCSLIGGVLSILTDQYVEINGFSNKFEYWGGEDDDLFKRIKIEDLTIVRFSPEISKYKMMQHRQAKMNKERKTQLQQNYKNHQEDGFNSLTYKKIRLRNEKLYTHVSVEL